MNHQLQGPVTLATDGLPPGPPKVSPGCDVCAALSRQWRHATDPHGPAHDPSHATDLAVGIGRHPHGRKRTP